MQPDQLNRLIELFTEKEVTRINFEEMDQAHQELVFTAMKTIILCDRYNKGEKIVEGLNFDLIRNEIGRAHV